MLKWAAILLLSIAGLGMAAHAAAPRLYRQPANEGPVRADPDDLLLLAGSGLRPDDIVVYEAVSDSTKVLSRPKAIPTQSTPEVGIAPIVSTANVPDSVTLRIPAQLRLDQTYALWVRNARGEWSEPAMINDARPLWFSPAFTYETAGVGSLTRELKVVGRNLQPAPGGHTQIQLTGPQIVSGIAQTDSTSSATLRRYTARLKLPGHLLAGRYQISVSRDAVSWVKVPGQMLEVRADAGVAPDFPVTDPRYGGCRPDDGRDDAPCVLRAIDAAQQAGGGAVVFGPGTWDLIDTTGSEGIVVPQGVSLRGAGRDLTRIDRHPQWNERAAAPAFTLLGHTRVSDLSFRDSQVYDVNDVAGPFLQLGEPYGRVGAAAQTAPVAASVDEVIISGNAFDKTYIAIGDGGLPINRLFITANVFGAYFEALRLTGDRYNVLIPFGISDSVVADNLFKPGSYVDRLRNGGSIASELGASLRVDFSGNVADGSSSDYLYRPDDPRGWRAAFFWSLNNNVEELLVSDNRASCTGDKLGDGEAISFDNNANTFALASLADVVSASESSVTVSAAPAARQNSRDVAVASYYSEHWIQIGSGPGLGQVRKIKGYDFDPKSRTTTFRVAPDWDVLPVPGRTRIAVGREYWQVYTVDNEVDHRQPLCLKSNRSRHHGGGIVLWAQSADSVIEGNRQFDSDGIILQQTYELPQRPCKDCTMQSFFQYFLDIRNNTIDGEYDWNTDCGASGITAGIAAVPWDDPNPPSVSYGVAIAHNEIRRADAAHGGAIAQLSSWYPGPAPYRWALSNNLLIHHNSIRDIDGPAALKICGNGKPRIGINFPAPDISWRTVLYANSCDRVAAPLGAARGVDTVFVCPSPGTSDSCECAGRTPQTNSNTSAR